MNRRADIQGLRAIAVLMVVIFHARLPLPGGFTGVDVFFVISGFVITAMLGREWQAEGRLSLRTFYLRRYMRLTPALAVTVAVTVIVSFFLLSPFGPQQIAGATGLGALLLSANLVIARSAGDYFAVDALQNPLLNTWSLSVEEQFYLVFPALMLVSWAAGRATGRRTATPLLIVGAVSALSFGLSLLWTNGSSFASWLTEPFGGPQVFAFYGPFTRIWEFGVGCLLAIWLARGAAHAPRWAVPAGVVGLVLIAASGVLITEAMPFPGWVAAVPVLGTALVIWAGTHTTSWVSRGLAARPLVALGDWSYSWYLWHWPLIVFAGVLLPGSGLALVVAAAVSLPIAWLSYRFVEQPLRGLRPRNALRTVGIIAVTTATPVVVAAVLVVGADSGWGGRFEQPVAATTVDLAAGDGDVSGAVTDPSASADGTASADGEGAVTENTTRLDLRSQHVAVAADCVNTDIAPQRCRFGPADATGTILMLGDSQAYAIADGLIPAASELGYDVVVSSRTGCPFLGRDSSGNNRLPCRPWQKAVLAYALESKPAAVVIANRSAGYVHPEWDWRTAVTEDGGRAASVSEAAALWQRGMTDVIRPLQEAGIPVLVIGSVAEMPQFSDQRSIFAQTFGAKAYEVPTDEVIAARQPALDAERAALATHPRSAVFDPIPHLCTDVCASAVDGTMLYQDETHLTVDGAKRLTDGLRASLAALLADAPTQP